MAPQRTSDRRKQEIVDIAARLFAERGYDAVGIDEIGAAAGISGPTLYWYFAGKQSVLEAVTLAGAEHFATALEAAAADHETPTLDDIVRAGVRVALDHPHLTATLLHDGHHLTDGARDAAQAVAVRTDAIARSAIVRLNPELGTDDADLRLAAHVGTLLAVATAHHGVARRRIETMAVAATRALAAVPPVGPGSPPARPDWQPTRARRGAIVHAARILFRDRGYHDVGIADIAKAAGISRPAIYHYFPSKQDILQAAWERQGIRLVAAALDAVDGATSADDALDRLARGHVPVVLDNLDLIVVVFRDLRHDPGHQGTWPGNRQVLLDTWLAVLAELHPDLGEGELRLLVEMVFSAAIHAALAAVGDPARHEEIATLIAAFARA